MLGVGLGIVQAAFQGSVASVPALALQALNTLPQPFTFRSQTPAIHIDMEAGYVKIGSLSYTSLAAAETAGVYNSTTKVFTFDPTAAGLSATPTAYTIHCEATTGPEALPAAVEQFFKLGGTASTTQNYIDFRRQVTTGLLTLMTNRAGTFRNTAIAGASPASTRLTAGGSVLATRFFLSTGGVAGSFNATAQVPAGTINKLEMAVSTAIMHKLIIWYYDFASDSIVRALSYKPTRPQPTHMVGGQSRDYGASNGDDLTLIPQYFSGATGWGLVKHDGVQPPHLIRTGQIGTGPSGKDDHNSPSLFRTSAGAVLMAQTSHGASAAVWYSRFATIDSDPTYVGALSTAAAGTIGEYAKFAQRASDGRLFLMTKTTDYAWSYATSDDDGLTWTGFKKIFEDVSGTPIKNYFDFRWLDNGRMGIAAVPNSAADNGYVALAEWDTATGKLYTSAEIGDISALAANVGVAQGLFYTIIASADVTYFVDWTWREDVIVARTYDRALDSIKVGVLRPTGGRYSPWTFTEAFDMGASYFGVNTRINGFNTVDLTSAGPLRMLVGRRRNGRDQGHVIEAVDAQGNGPWVEKELLFDNDAATSVTFRVTQPQNPSPDFPAYWVKGNTYSDYNSYDTFRMQWPGSR